MKQRIVLSGVNLVEAGPLAIFQDALAELSAHFADRYEIIAMVHRRALFHTPAITFFEFPGVKRSWMRRLHFEFWQAHRLSERLRPYLWFSMHDITPWVTADVQAVYCHNPAPFYRQPLRKAFLDWTFTLFALFYRFLYQFRIGHNAFVVVQQEWMRDAFRARYRKVRRIVVAHPSLHDVSIANSPRDAGTPVRFFYPAFPRSFKNVEQILAAVERLEAHGVSGFEVCLTLRGDENPYARGLLARFGGLGSVRWLGALSREAVLQEYGQADCLLFPSRLETWGMPISEFKLTGKPMLVADLPYAHETVGSYDAVRFVSCEDADALAEAMHSLLRGTLRFEGVQAKAIAAPFAQGWRALFDLLLASTESL